MTIDIENQQKAATISRIWELSRDSCHKKGLSTFLDLFGVELLTITIWVAIWDSALHMIDFLYIREV